MPPARRSEIWHALPGCPGNPGLWPVNRACYSVSMRTTVRYYFWHFHIQHLTGAGVANA